MSDKIVLDCETQKMFQEIKDRSHIWDLKLSTAVTFSYKENRYRFWTYTKQEDLLEYLTGNTVIGFNSITFDCPLIMGESHKLDVKGNSASGKYYWVNYDILHELKKKLYAIDDKTPINEVFDIFRKNFSASGKGTYSLEGVVNATLNYNYVRKEDPIELFRTKKILDLFEFNLQNVRLTKQLYEFILKHKYLLNGQFDVIRMG